MVKDSERTIPYPYFISFELENILRYPVTKELSKN